MKYNSNDFDFFSLWCQKKKDVFLYSLLWNVKALIWSIYSQNLYVEKIMFLLYGKNRKIKSIFINLGRIKLQRSKEWWPKLLCRKQKFL